MELGKTMKVVNVVDSEEEARFIEPAINSSEVIVEASEKVSA